MRTAERPHVFQRRANYYEWFVISASTITVTLPTTLPNYMSACVRIGKIDAIKRR